MASEMLHESAETLSPETVDRHRAISSVMEELEAIDWYDQRVDATTDEELKAILAHNRDEEKEHASMVLEWLRRRDEKIDQFFREYLFSEGSITAREEEQEHGAGAGNSTPEHGASRGTSASSEGAGHGIRDCSLGIGSLKSEIRA